MNTPLVGDWMAGLAAWINSYTDSLRRQKCNDIVANAYLATLYFVNKQLVYSYLKFLWVKGIATYSKLVFETFTIQTNW